MINLFKKVNLCFSNMFIIFVFRNVCDIARTFMTRTKFGLFLNLENYIHVETGPVV